MEKFTYKIKDPLGFHARPVGLMVRAINQLPCKITISYQDKVVDAKRLYAVLGLGVKTGEEITITCEGEDEKSTLQLILDLFEKENL